jgi:DNA-binding transcriptional ArsR family regulator
MTNSFEPERASVGVDIDENQEQVNALMEPIRLKLYVSLQQPRTVSEVADALGVDRKSLYYHLKVLISVGLVEEQESHKVRNFTETVYKAKDKRFKCSDFSGPEKKKQLRILMMNLMKELSEDHERAMLVDTELRAGMARDTIKLKSENLTTVYRVIDELMNETFRKVLEFHDEDGDVDYAIAFAHFKMEPESHTDAKEC